MQKNNFWEITEADIPLIEYTNIFFGNLVWMERGIDKDVATYDLVVREIPETWSFYIFDGIERAIHTLLNYRFDEESIVSMKAMNLINSIESENFYRNFAFSGDVWMMKAGTIFFPGEPIVRITAPIAEANMLTAFLLNVFGYPIRLLTKTVRFTLATGNAKVLATCAGVVRLPGFEQSIYVQRVAKMLNHPIVAPFFYRKFPEYLKDKKKIVMGVNHAVIKSFTTERDAYEFTLKNMGDKVDLALIMIDTYDLKQGLDIFISVLKDTPTPVDPQKFMITIDSGDLFEFSHYVRKTLDSHGLNKIGIQAFSNLDEYRVKKLVDAGAPIDYYVAATEIVNISDNPRFEAVYKMSELRKPDGSIEQKAKLTKGKESYPGRKQVFRVYEDGLMKEDIIGLEEEHLGVPLLYQFIHAGKLSISIPTLEESAEHLKNELSALPTKYKNVAVQKKYPVCLSNKLSEVLKEVTEYHLKESSR